MTSEQLLLLRSAHALITQALPPVSPSSDRDWLLDILDELATFIETSGSDGQETSETKYVLAE